MNSALLDPEIKPPPIEGARRLSEDLQELLREAAGRSVTIGQLEHALRGRGFAFSVLVLSLPFALPITIPGLSIPLGTVLMVMGFRIMMGQQPKLPGMILRHELSYKMLERIVAVGLKVAKWLEKFAKPRVTWLQSPVALRVVGLGIASGGLQLLLPLPPLIPFSNWFPAISVILLTAGMIERDGAITLSGFILNIGGWIYFIVMFVILGDGLMRFLRWMNFT